MDRYNIYNQITVLPRIVHRARTGTGEGKSDITQDSGNLGTQVSDRIVSKK